MFCLLVFAAALRAGAAELDDRVAEIALKNAKNLVFVQGSHGGGSGFLANYAGAKWVLTNQYVIAGCVDAKFIRADQSQIRTTRTAGAVGHDVMALAADPAEEGMELLSEVEKNVAIGDDVAVLGNPDGAGVMKPILGKVQGIGPKLVEVSAAFVPGNSGSPVVHVKTGKVIAVATYAKVQRKDPFTGAKIKEVRRFCFRLDSIKRWETVEMWAFHEEAKTMDAVKLRTARLIEVADNCVETGAPSAFAMDGELRAAMTKFAQAVTRPNATAPDRAAAKQTLSGAMRAAFVSDITIADRRVGYDYFKTRLAEETEIREEITKAMERLVTPAGASR